MAVFGLVVGDVLFQDAEQFIFGDDADGFLPLGVGVLLAVLLLRGERIPEFVEVWRVGLSLRCCGLCHRNFRGCLGFGVYGRFRDG